MYCEESGVKKTRESVLILLERESDPGLKL